MTLSSRRYVGLPPDGVGKKVASRYVMYLEFNNASGEFFENETIIGGTSAITATILRIILSSPTAGQLMVQLDEQFFNSSFTIGETISVAGGASATAVNAGVEVFYNEVVSVSGQNPSHRQTIDSRGSSYITFAQGAPQVDSFGKLKTSIPTVIGNYTQFYSASFTDQFSVRTGSGAESVTYLPNQSATVLQVDDASGSFVQVTSNRYHVYLPGIGVTVMQTGVCGDSGKQNLIRRWGYFDDNNGLFWEQSGSVVSVVVRSNITGTPQETRIPQSLWNRDRVDGSESTIFNTSKMELDVTKNNIYVIDFQWLSAGRIRFGLYTPEGEYTRVHTVENANTLAAPWMSKPNLPVRYEIINVGATAGTSEYKLICASVQADVTDLHDQLPQRNKAYSLPTVTISSSAQYTTIATGRAVQYFSGQENRSDASVDYLSVYAQNPIVVELVKNATLSGAAWTSAGPESILEIDVTGSSTGGEVLFSAVFDGNDFANLVHVFSDQEAIRRKADITEDPDIYTLRTKLLSGSTATLVGMSMNWIEHR